MKLLKLTLLTLPLLLTACSGDSSTGGTEPVPSPTPTGSTDNVIRFSTSIQGMTRTEFRSDLSNLTGFMCAAMTNVSSPEMYFDAEEVSMKADGTWNTGVTHYWPEQSLQFFAFAPYTLPVSITPSAQRLSGFQVAAKPALMTDIITAWGQGSKPAANAVNAPVSLSFHHALSRIEVQVSNPSDTKVKVLGVKICRIPSIGTMTMQKTASGFPTWSLTAGSAKDYIIKGSADATDATGVVTIQNSTSPRNVMFGQGGWLMIPQQLTPWSGGNSNDGAYIAVLCQVLSGSGQQLFPDEAGKYGFTAVPIDTKWEPGHNYVYTLNFFQNTGTAGLVDPDPTSPDGPDSDIDTTPGGNRGGGDAVVNKPISFTVNITDWVSGAGDNTEIDF